MSKLVCADCLKKLPPFPAYLDRLKMDADEPVAIKDGTSYCVRHLPGTRGKVPRKR